LLKAWESFIAEFKLPAEITTFSIKAKQRLYIRLGTWKEKAHPQAKPVEIWKKACLSGSYPLPKLRISSLSMRFASDIGELGFHVFEHLDEDSESECEDDSESECENDSEESCSISEPEKEESGVRMKVVVRMRMMERQSIWYQMQVVTSAPINFLCCINLASIPMLWISCCRSL
jgi:hypothetical protein